MTKIKKLLLASMIILLLGGAVRAVAIVVRTSQAMLTT